MFENFEMPLLFCDYYDHLVRKQRNEEDAISAHQRAVNSGNIKILTDTLDKDFVQWELMKKLTSNIEPNADGTFIRGNNPNGGPWTIYYINDSCLKGNDEAYFRIGENKDGYYLSFRQYLKYDSEENMRITGINDKNLLYNEKMDRLHEYRECFQQSVRELNKDINIIHSNKGAYESEIGAFQLDCTDTLVWLEDNLAAVTNRFLQLVKQRWLNG